MLLRPARPLAGPASLLRAAVALALLLGAAGGCASARRAAQKPVEMGDPEERILGARLAAAFEDSVSIYVDRDVQGYVNQIGQRLARLSDRPSIPYTFRILRQNAPRGVVLPGGYVYVSVGLLRHLRSQCEVAAVLAHMVAHASLGHPVKALETADGVGRNGIREILGASDRKAGVERARTALRTDHGYPREWESEADRLTLLYLSRIGISAEGYQRSIETFLPPLSRTEGTYWEPMDHAPPLDKRLSMVKADYASMGLDAGLTCDQSKYAPIRARLGAP